MTLKNKHVVVTGGGSGVGEAIALKLAENSSLVTILGRRNKPLKQVSAKHKNINWRVCDVSSSEEVESCYNDIRSEYGNINIVIANAGIASSKPFHKMSVQDITSLIDVNLIGVFNSFQHALIDMKSDKWGRMISIASTAGLKGYSYVSAYSASKHAVIGLTKSLALELANKGITVNSICPSYVDTPMTDRTIKNITELTNISEEEAISELVKSNPQKRLIKPIEIAEVVSWLCDKNSDSINGQSIPVSGGEI
jgi:NAD(P)-dependent dehydrogenase (short-subunit alcohol dehydrogenase family)